MTSHESDQSLPPQERLDAAKAVFRESILKNDIIFNMVQTSLGEHGNPGGSLPDFDLEPTLRRHSDTSYTMGLRVGHSATVSGIIKARVASYDYLALGKVVDSTTGETEVLPDLEAALRDTGGIEDDANDVFQAWQSGVSEVVEQSRAPLVIDPMSGTLELERNEPIIFHDLPQ